MITITGQAHAMASVLKREKAEFPVPTGSFRVPKKKIPCSRRSGNLRSKDWNSCVIWHQRSPQIVEIKKIPCYFPCSQGIANLKDADPVSADRSTGLDIRKRRD
jgi:hypothetical protein